MACALVSAGLDRGSRLRGIDGKLGVNSRVHPVSPVPSIK